MSSCWTKKFNCICREKNRVPFHWVLLMSPGQLMQIWRLYKERKFMTIRMSTRTEICQIRGRVSQDLRYLNETPLKWQRQSEENWREFKRHHVQITYGRTHWKQLGKQLKEERNNNKWIEKLLFHAKDRVPEHAYGKPMFQNNKSQMSEAKFICIDIAGERQNSV